MADKPTHEKDHTDPAFLRGIFGANLRLLSQDYPSVAGLCRELGINRTQYNRYLAGESFPRPDVLHRICRFFGVDARMLLQAVDDIPPSGSNLLDHPFIREFLGSQSVMVDEHSMPSGFYRFVRRSFISEEKYVSGLVYVFRRDDYTFLRGYEAKDGMRHQGLPDSASNREFRGMVLRQEEGISALIAHRNAMTCTFNFLTRVTAFENNFWEGYATRTARESLSGHRVARMIYEYIGKDFSRALNIARNTGYCELDELTPFHRRLLRPDEWFR